MHGESHERSNRKAVIALAIVLRTRVLRQFNRRSDSAQHFALDKILKANI
jgi:hypothetical protein